MIKTILTRERGTHLTMEPDRSVVHLQGLHTVVVGVALFIAINKLVDAEADVPTHFGALPYFVAYLVTLVPIYHRALRHLDVAYLEGDGHPRAEALMVD